MAKSRISKFVVGALALSLVAAACGDDDDGAPAAAGATTAAAGATTAPAAAAATAGAAPLATAPPTTVATDAFPVTIEHKFGTTEIPAEPDRVVSVGFNDQDTILAFGVVPVGIRDWFGDQPSATWPWAHDLLGGAEPAVLASSELNFEQIAALRPDLIIGVYSGMTETEYQQLAEIAPTLAQTAAFIDYGTPWQDATMMIGRALGRTAEAEALVADVEARIAQAAAAHPDFAGATATVSYVLDADQIGAYGPQDPRSRLLTDLGLVIPQEIADLAGDSFFSSFSWEQIGLLDRDLLIWISGEPGIVDQIKASPLRQGLRAVTEGREIFLTDLESGAASFSSVLSLPYLLDSLVPKMAAAVDGDPATEVPS